MVDHLGEQFGDYRLTRKLGGGNFGDVYLGVHTSFSTPAAVKILQARLSNSEDLKDYINEIRTLFRLQHPNIVPLLDFGIERDIPFLIMAYAPNGTLRQPKGTRLSVDTVLGYIRQIAEALQCAHDLKLVHRDVKPDNILLGPYYQVWLSDFGIVSIAHSTRSLNIQGGAGTIAYMAPEQIQGKARPASDQYSLGIITYEWICGVRPFNGTAVEIAMQHSHVQPPSMCEQVSTLSSIVEQVVLKTLAKEPKDRFGSVREFVEAFARAVKLSELAPQKTKEQWLDEGIVHRRAGRYKEAFEAYDCAIHLDPKYAPAYHHRGFAYHDLEMNEKAIEDYTRAIHLDPRDVLAYYHRGLVYHDLKEYEKAIVDYTRVVELDPRFARGYSRRGLVYYYLKDYQRAVQDLDRTLQLDPNQTWFEFEREDAYSKLGRKL